MKSKTTTTVETDSVIKSITQATEEARHVLAQEAADAKKVINEATAEACKIKNTKQDGDHDLIVELRVRMEDLKNAIQALTDGTAKKIDDHEKRILDLEGSKVYINVMLTVGSALLVLLSGLIFFHIFGMKP